MSGPSKCPSWPGSHQWKTVDIAIEARGDARTYAVERCTECGDLRVDYSVEVIEKVGDRDAQ